MFSRARATFCKVGKLLENSWKNYMSFFLEKSCPKICIYQEFFVPLHSFSKVKKSCKHRVKPV